jgi:hypothetical protein
LCILEDIPAGIDPLSQPLRPGHSRRHDIREIHPIRSPAWAFTDESANHRRARRGAAAPTTGKCNEDDVGALTA